MHYVPESPAEFLQDRGERLRQDKAARSFHYRSAPIYLLTAVVGLLLGTDLLVGLIDDVTWTAYRTVGGFRLALLAAVLGGARILYQTLESLFEGKVGADLALTIAALAAIALGEHTTAALVVFIALCGESIEGYTVDRARRAIRRIFDLQPPTACVLRDNREIEIPVDEVTVGETIVLRPGERVPVDGKVVNGNSAIDESALTGESLPVEKSSGDDVFTGTLNQFGSLTLFAERVGEDTTLSQVVQLVTEAAEKKAPLERTADRLARLFLPVVLGIAALTLIGWWWQTGQWTSGFRPMLAVLVVACPCPLVLATPTAVMAAMAWLARTGVVVKGSAALERLATVDSFAFDKTGTLTQGQPAIGLIQTFGEVDEAELLRTAAIAERNSEHLLARLIVREARRRQLDISTPTEFHARPGAGVIATDGSRQIVVGSRRLLESESIAVAAEVEEQLAELDADGQMVLLVAVDEVVLGVIGVRDLPREASKPVLAELRQEGIAEFAMLTGDRSASANSVAAFLGMEPDAVHAELFPADKAKWIEEQTSRGRHVAMVGDGINDAPALATATVGLALGGVGSDIAAEAGDLVLMGDPLRPLPGLLRLSRQLVGNIRQSIFLFAFGMNFLGMVLGAVGVLDPVAAAVFHECSSLAVMINAMRLLWFERWDQTWFGLLSNRFSNAADWLTDSFSPTKWVFRLIDHRGLLTRLAAIGLAVWWLTSGIVKITADEEALVTRFGRYEATLQPGLHWRWPAPFERIRRERVGRIRTVQLGFNQPDSARSANVLSPQTIEWTSEHSETGYRPNPEESLILTGDEVLVEMTADVQFRIANLHQYIYGGRNPAAIVRAVTESAIRDVAARTALDDLLTSRRAAVRRECLQLARQRLQPYGIGVELVGLNLLDVHPPVAVVPAYRDVANAMEEKEQSINEAEGYYVTKVLGAVGERGMQTLQSLWYSGDGRDLRAAALGVISQRPVEEKTWSQLWAAMSRKSVATDKPELVILTGTAAAELMAADANADTTLRNAEAERDRFLSLLNILKNDATNGTRLELYWKTIGDVLESRPLTILDPNVAGRKHLLLMDPNAWDGMTPLRQSFPAEEETPPEKP